MPEEETRDYIIDILNNEEPVKEEPAKEEIKEESKEEVKEDIKPKAKAKSKSRAKPKIKLVKESVEPIEPIVVETVGPPVVVEEEKPKKIYKLKEIVKCPDCSMLMTVHTLKYIHKRRGFVKR